MTAETDLLPVMWRAPKRGGGWMYFDHDPTHLLGVEPLLTAHAIAPLQAEIEALRAELEIAKGQGEFYRTARNAQQRKAERLAEAGRRVTAAFRALGDSSCITAAAIKRRECEAAMLAFDALLRDQEKGK